MAQRNPAARLAIVLVILAAAAGIYMLWRHTRSLVDRDAHKRDGTMLLAPAHPGASPDARTGGES